MIKKLLQFSIGSIGAAAISFFTTPIITYLIIPEYFGIAALFSTVATFLFPIINFGTDQAFMRFFYEKKESERCVLLWSCLFPCFFVFIFLCCILFIFRHRFVVYFFQTDRTYILLLLYIDLFLRLINRYGLLAIRMQQKALLFSIVNLCASIINAGVIIFYAAFIERSYFALLYGGVFSNFITVFVAILIERKFWFTAVKISFFDIKKVLAYSTPLVAANFFAILFDGLDKYCLKQFSTFYELGLYTAAFKIVAALRIVQTGFSMYWTPVAFEHYEKNKNDTALYEQVFDNLLFFLVLLGLLLILFKDVVVLILNKNYFASVDIIPFLVFIPIMYTITEVTNIGVYFKKKMVYETYAFVVLDIAAVGMNFIFISKFGAKGAAMAVAILYLAYFYIRTFFSIKLYPMKFNLLKASMYFVVLWLVALINTFFYFNIVKVLSAFLAFLFVLIYDKKLFREWMSRVFFYIQKRLNLS